MKNRQLPAYPVLTEEVKNKISVQPSEFRFRSMCGVEPASNGASWPGPVCFGQNGSWTPSQNDLGVEITFVFQNLSFLFSAEGIACAGSTLGVSLEWTAPDSDQRGLSNVISFNRNTSVLEATFSINFDVGQILGKIFLDVLLFVIDPDPEPDEDIRFRANTAGMCFGRMTRETCMMDLDGNGRLFPVEEVMGAQDDPLWRLRYDSIDAASDAFSTRNLALQINARHSDYPMWKGDGSGSTRLTPFARNIVASWLTLFILAMKEKEPEVYEKLGTSAENDFEPGSVADAANYLLETFNIHRESVAELSYSFDRSVTRKILDYGERL